MSCTTRCGYGDGGSVSLTEAASSAFRNTFSVRDLLPKDPTCVNLGNQDSLGVDIVANADLGGQLSAVGIGGLLQRRFGLRCFCIFLRERSAAKANRQHEACEYAFHGGSLFAFSA